MASLTGRIIAITGAASGMGLAIAKLLASKGAILSLADLNEKPLRELISTLEGGEHMFCSVDVRNSGDVENWISKTVEKLGRIDGGVNFAGVCRMKRIIETTEEDWNFNMDINAKGVFFCTKAQLKHMKAGGSIVNASSINGQIGWPELGAYSASKHAVIGMSRTAAKENPKIRVNCIAPGVVDTPMTAHETAEESPEVAQQALKRKGDPIEIANVVAFLLSSEASFITGAVYNVDGGFVC